MSIRISKNPLRVTATGDDANCFFIAFLSDEQLLEADRNKTGSEKFQKAVKEAMAARGLINEGDGI